MGNGMARQRLPVIVGFGGVNSAGRASGHRAYDRIVYSALGQQQKAATLDALGRMMGLENAADNEQHILDHTLIRRIEKSHFDADAVRWNQRLPTQSAGLAFNFDVERRHLPEHVPSHWQVESNSVTHVNVSITGEQEFLLPTLREFDVKSAGMLPTGFEPGKLYPARNHPRGLEMTVYAASDALGSLGIEWEEVGRHVAADEVSVYAGSAMGQLDQSGAGGMLKSRYNGQRVSSKFCPFSFAEMPADFINAYVLGSLGSTGASLGACASFLYNLRHGIDDIRSGRARVAFIGAAEAPVTPEIMEGYSAMGALATEKGLRKIEGIGQDKSPDPRRACRPFADNCGFTIAESAQMVVLFDDALAMELGASVYGAATDVFVNADGHKKSISGPGVGNYITMAKAAAAVRAIIGEKGLRHGGFVQAHGTGTPQNRVTESEILSRTADMFGIEDWPVVATKCFLGHSIGAAAGDQLSTALGIWARGILPGITTIDEIADDVQQAHLGFSNTHRELLSGADQYAIINSKGFGGNNASAAILSPQTSKRMLQSRYSKEAWRRWRNANEAVQERQQAHDSVGLTEAVYKFDHGVLQDGDVQLGQGELSIGGRRVSLQIESPYDDMTLI